MLQLVCVVVLLAAACGDQTFQKQKLKNGGQHWGVIVAGSNTWFNYRHQADACHAYQIMKKHGVPKENIIVMMYDDIAYNRLNPTKGIIINHPNGHDVYKGVEIDYKGEDVTPDNFLSVLTGDKQAMSGIGTGRVLESGPNDHVFVNFVDHGAPGLIAFPSSELHARPFNQALQEMYKKKMYAQMVIYIEACESGSMFKNILPPDINIYATTAANAKESSYAIYYDEKRRTYLGDVYSVAWMENSDASNLDVETLMQQFVKVRTRTNTSHVQEFGELSITKEPVGDFQGNAQNPENIYYPSVEFDGVPSHDVEIHTLAKSIAASLDEEEKLILEEELVAEINKRSDIRAEMKNIASVAVNQDKQLIEEILTSRSEELYFDCYEGAVHHYKAKCRPLSSNSYALKHLYVLQNLCNVGDMSLVTIYSAIDKVCTN